jgi:GH25 family lysozyme M1 (1,4-beta-N-acetylmuramidase)
LLFAEYGMAYPSGQFDFTIWQYANDGQVAGIAAAVDMNIELVHSEQQ